MLIRQTPSKENRNGRTSDVPILLLLVKQDCTRTNRLSEMPIAFYGALLLLFILLRYLLIYFSLLILQYGKKKNIMFHDQKFLNKITASKTGAYCAFDGGHWFMTENPEGAEKCFRDFLLV